MHPTSPSESRPVSIFPKLVLAWLVVAVGATASRAGESRLDKKLPEDTLAYVSIDTGALSKNLRSLSIAKLLGEPEVREFLAPLVRQLPVPVGVDAVDGESAPPIDALLQGLLDSVLADFLPGRLEAGVSGLLVELVDDSGKVERLRLSGREPVRSYLIHRLLLTQSRVNGKPLADPTISLDFAIDLDSGPSLHQLATTMLMSLPGNMTRGSTEIEGRQIHEIQATLRFRQGLLPTRFFVYATPERWILAGDRERMASMLRGNDIERPLAADADFQRSRARTLEGASVVEAYVSLKRLFAMARPLAPPLLFDELALLGIDGIEGLSYGMSMVDGGIRDTFRIAIREPRGMLAQLAAFGGGIEALDTATPGMLAFAGAHFDVRAAHEATMKFITESVLPGSRTGIERRLLAPIDAVSVLGPLDDIIGSLGDEIDFEIGAMMGPIPNAVLTMTLGDEQGFAKLLERFKELAREGQGQLSFGEMALTGGRKATTLSLPGMPFQPALTIEGGKLHAALLGFPALQAHLTKLASSSGNPTTDPGLARLGKIFPLDDLGLLLYVDLKRTLPIGLTLGLNSMIFPAGGGPTLDPAKMPSPTTMAQHFSAMALGASRSDEDVCLDLFTPTGAISILLAIVGMEPAAAAPAVETVPKPSGGNR